MRIEKTGDYLVIKDNQNQVKHITPYNGVFIHRHSFDNNFILLSDRSKKSVKDAIRIKVSDVDKVGSHWVRNPSRGILMLYLSMLLDPSKSILDTETSVDNHRLLNTNSSEYQLEYEAISDEPTHIFNSYDAGQTTLLFVGQPEESFSFRITNGGFGELWVKDADEESLFNYTFTGSPAIQQKIPTGKTVQVNYDVETNIYTMTDI